MYTATGYPELIRAFRLNLTIEGLRPRTIQNYVGDVEPVTHRRGSPCVPIRTSSCSTCTPRSANFHPPDDRGSSRPVWQQARSTIDLPT